MPDLHLDLLSQIYTITKGTFSKLPELSHRRIFKNKLDFQKFESEL
jgi:hypothetical protein